MNYQQRLKKLNYSRYGRIAFSWCVFMLLLLFFTSCANKILVSDKKESQSIPSTKQNSDTIVMGRVTDIEGKPIADARIVIREWKDSPRHYSETYSDVNGEYSLDALPGSSRLFVYADGYCTMYQTHDVFKGVNKGWDFLLPKGVSVSGRIIDTKGKPLPNRIIELWKMDSPPPPSPGTAFVSSGGMVKTNKDGIFDMPNAASGKYRIVVYKESSFGGDRSMQQVPIKGRFIQVESGEHVKNFEIVVNPAEDFTISGHVLNSEGSPMKGIVVDTFIPHGRHWWTKTDENGAFLIEGLDGMGQSSLKVHFNGILGAGNYKLCIPEVPINTKDVDLIVPGTGSIQGTVRNAKTGELIPTYEISVPVVYLPDSEAVWEEPCVRIEVNEDGIFTISDIPAAEAVVEISANGLGAQRFTVPIEANKITPLDYEMEGPAVFAGKTTSKGKPRKTTIVINGEWVGTDDEGNFRFDKYPNGELQVWFFVYDGWHRTVEVNLKSGETTWLDMELDGTCDIHGKVILPDDEDFCNIRLAGKPSPDGWYEFGRPGVEECVFTYSRVNVSGGEYQMKNIPAGQWYLMAGKYRPSMHRSILGASRFIELKEGESIRVDFDLTETNQQ